MIDLGRELEKYSKSDFYPFHMPGHKRIFDPGFNAYDVDITEIEPFDDLHHPRGILRELQAQCAEFFGAMESFYLVNGSSCGILSAITVALDTGRYYLILDRGSHKSAYNAVILKDAEPEYVFSRPSEFGFYEGIYPQDVDTLLKKRHDFCRESEKKTLKPCLFVTSPTYDGITSDIAALAELIHERDGLLIVDEAHGAHFGMHDIFPESAVRQGADIVIQSLHKTLPAPTQTSVLHILSPRAQELDIGRYLAIFESSSPSYILMSGISSCLNFLDSRGKEYFDRFANRLDLFYRRVEKLRALRVYRHEYDNRKRDISKILIGTGNTGLTGHDLYRILGDRYHLRLEMEASFYVTALSSLMDTDEGFERLAGAILEIDGELADGKSISGKPATGREITGEPVTGRLINGKLSTGGLTAPYPEPVTVCHAGSAFRAQKKAVLLDEAADRVSGVFVFLYPPGIPVLAPGELVTAEIIELIRGYVSAGFDVRGLAGEEPLSIEVCE